MATNPATESDLGDRSLRPLTQDELNWGTTRLADAFDQLLMRLPSIALKLDAPTPDPAFKRLVIQVQCAMVLRVLANPDGKLEEQGDDYRYRLDAAVSTGSLYVTDAELALLSGPASTAGAFTIRPAYSTPLVNPFYPFNYSTNLNYYS